MSTEEIRLTEEIKESADPEVPEKADSEKKPSKLSAFISGVKRRMTKRNLTILGILASVIVLIFGVVYLATPTYKTIPDGDGGVIIIGYHAMKLHGQNLYIPGEIDGKRVTGISSFAFKDFDKVVNVVIPSTVTFIGDSAFQDCSLLVTVSIPDSVTSIGNSAFQGCRRLSGVTIPNSVVSIGDKAFYYCVNLTKVVIPDSVTGIGSDCFSHCRKLESVTLSKNMTVIPDHAFYYCDKLTTIELHEGITSIGASAFGDCSKLAHISVPKSVIFIGNNAFPSKTVITYFIGSYTETWCRENGLID